MVPCLFEIWLSLYGVFPVHMFPSCLVPQFPQEENSRDCIYPMELFLLLLFVCFLKILFIWRTEITSRQGGRQEREEEAGSCWADSFMQGSIPGVWDHDLSRRQRLNLLSHPGAPKCHTCIRLNKCLQSLSVAVYVCKYVFENQCVHTWEHLSWCINVAVWTCLWIGHKPCRGRNYVSPLYPITKKRAWQIVGNQ